MGSWLLWQWGCSSLSHSNAPVCKKVLHSPFQVRAFTSELCCLLEKINKHNDTCGTMLLTSHSHLFSKRKRNYIWSWKCDERTWLKHRLNICQGEYALIYCVTESSWAVNAEIILFLMFKFHKFAGVVFWFSSKHEKLKTAKKTVMEKDILICSSTERTRSFWSDFYLNVLHTKLNKSVLVFISLYSILNEAPF